jgi:hypothetical protein
MSLTLSVVRDVPYTDTLLDKHKLDIYIPSSVKGPKSCVPVVFHVHGGGWRRGDRTIFFYGAPFMAAAFAERGFVRLSFFRSLFSSIVIVTFPLRAPIDSLNLTQHTFVMSPLH